MARTPRSPTPSDQVDSQSHTVSETPIQEEVHKEDDASTTSHPHVSKPVTTNPDERFEIPTSVPINEGLFQEFSISSPTSTVSTPITIAPSH